MTAGTQAPVGTVGNGYVYGTFNQPTPISGTFMGMRGRERITDQFGNAGPGLTVPVLERPAAGLSGASSPR